MSKQINLFWWRWLMGATFATILFSFALILFPDQLQTFFNWLFFTLTDRDVVLGETAVHYISFIYKVLGAVMIGWMITVLFLLLGPFRKGDPMAWNTITTSIVIWFVGDSVASILSGFAMNAVFNIGFLVLFIIPLAATYRQFK